MVNMLKIKFAKLRPEAIIPSKRDEDSDFDLYACFEEDELVIPPFESRLIPTGIASAFAENVGVKYEERGSNSKWCGIVQAGVIDSGYRGEWFVAVYNGNSLPVHISKRVNEVERTSSAVLVPYVKAVCQFNVREIPKVETQCVSYQEILAERSERSTGMLGSSGK